MGSKEIITIVRPSIMAAKWAHMAPSCPPVGAAYVAGALLDAGYIVYAIDAVGLAPEQYLETAHPSFLLHGLSFDEIVLRIPPESHLIGVSCMFSHEWPEMRHLIRDIRKAFPEATVVVGGEHMTALPDFSMRDCDAIDVGVLGEGEETFVQLAAALFEGGALDAVDGIVYRDGDDIKYTPQRQRIKNLDELPAPAWELFPLDVYLDNELGFGVNRGRSMPIIASRGCPYRCAFCSNTTMWHARWIARDPKLLFAEMKADAEKYRIANFDFYDQTTIVSRDWIVELCHLIIDGGLDITWQLPSGTRSEVIDEEVAELLFASGCRNMSFAPESGSVKILESIHKKISLKKLNRAIRASVKAGIKTKANIMFGFPNETHRDAWRTVWYCVEMSLIGLHEISVSPFSPYPGSELFEQMRESGQVGELNDEYFYALAAYTDQTKTISFSSHIGDRALGFYRHSGWILFFAVSFLTRPWRIVKIIRNMFRQHQESRLEAALKDWTKRFAASRKHKQK